MFRPVASSEWLVKRVTLCAGRGKSPVANGVWRTNRGSELVFAVQSTEHRQELDRLFHCTKTVLALTLCCQLRDAMAVLINKWDAYGCPMEEGPCSRIE